MLRNVKKPTAASENAVVNEMGANSGAILSMQMDSVDRGYQTAEFGGDKSLLGLHQHHHGNNSSRDLQLDKDTLSYRSLIEDLSSTFTTLRDLKRKEALETLAELLGQAKFHCTSTQSAYEAIQRYKALICKKFELANKIRVTRDNPATQRAAQSNRDLIKLEEFHEQVGSLSEQAKQ